MFLGELVVANAPKSREAVDEAMKRMVPGLTANRERARFDG